jgi:hypothetical protein
MKIRHKKIHPDKILIAELYLKIKEMEDQRERRVKSWKKAEAEQEQQIKVLKDLLAKIAPYIWCEEFELIEEAKQALK